ncbi:phospho-N-acetylmuramoyl-pentapeptide-transferase, partial [Bacillus thuringiensis]|nr:phospho-N-acetylmuramoyl-pentapeptide-transferase [Bacillus thuringiensis]
MLEQGLLVTAGVAFLISVALSPLFIPFLRKLKFGQSIRDEGPKSHQKKSGTPTMGGIVIYVSMMVTSLIMAIKFNYLGAEVSLLLLVTFGYGLIGFLDDYIKVV